MKLRLIARSLSRTAAPLLAACALFGAPLVSAGGPGAFHGQLPSPVGYWTFDSCNQTTVEDHSGVLDPQSLQPQHGNKTGGLTQCVAAAKGTDTERHAHRFDGIDDLVTVPHTKRVDLRKRMTLSLWVNADSAINDQTLVSKGVTGHGWRLGINQGVLSFSAEQSQGSRAIVSTPAPSNRWVQVTVTFSSGTTILYVDGIEQSRASNFPSSLPSSPVELHIGGEAGYSSLLGSLDEVRLYAGVLTPRQVVFLTSGQNWIVHPVYVYPADHTLIPEAVTAARLAVAEVQQWYRQMAGVTFAFTPLKVVQSRLNYLNMRCGRRPNEACASNPNDLSSWGNALGAAAGLNLNEPNVALVFSQGGGGYAAGGLWGKAGFAYTGDWVLEPLSGVINQQGLPCGIGNVYCQRHGALGTVAHELGHGLGLLFHNGLPERIMSSHLAYPNATFTEVEKRNLRLNPALIAAQTLPVPPVLSGFEVGIEQTAGRPLTLLGQFPAGVPSKVVIANEDGTTPPLSIDVPAGSVAADRLTVTLPVTQLSGICVVRVMQPASPTRREWVYSNTRMLRLNP